MANFKSNLSLAEVQSWLTLVEPSPDVLVAPSSPHLSLFTGKHLCSQDVSPFPRGSYTGAVSATQLKELGVSYCIVGHSERRRYFRETPVDVASKVRELLAVAITPIVCMEDSDIIPQFSAIDDEYLDSCLYCFEPSADIGGTVTASRELILSVKNKVRDFVPNARFMYGGSVNSDNVTELLDLGLAGVLVASASLDPHSFNSILSKVTHVA